MKPLLLCCFVLGLSAVASARAASEPAAAYDSGALDVRVDARARSDQGDWGRREWLHSGADETAQTRASAGAEPLMEAAKVPGLALAVTRDGRIVHLKAYGQRDMERGLPLTVDTVMYAASLTKGAFAYAVMILVDEGRLDLDRSIAVYLPKPLPEYDKYADLAGDERRRLLTPRMLLSHTAGFPNFRFFTAQGYDENAKLAFQFEPAAVMRIPAKASTCCSS